MFQRRSCTAFANAPTRAFSDEPLYGHYLHTSEAVHPGEEEVLKAIDNDGERVVREVLLGPCGKPVLFFKNMAHHLPGLNPDFLGKLTNLLLIRDPREMLSLTHQSVAAACFAGHGVKGTARDFRSSRSRAAKHPWSSTPKRCCSTPKVFSKRSVRG